MPDKKTINVFDPGGKYLSNCTWNKANRLVQSNRAIRINSGSIRLKQTKRQKAKEKQEIILQAKRICYICEYKIPENEIATIDHIIPKSKDARADIITNMRCCCVRCNNDKGNKTLSEYVNHISKKREDYYYITDKRLRYLRNYAKYIEDEFYSSVNVHVKDFTKPYKNTLYKKRGRRR